MGEKIKDNYKAWSVKKGQFNRLKSDELKLKFLLKFAVLAPSGHNAQPWKVSIEDKKINIFFEKKRLLPVGDPTNRLTYISIGCFIKNLIIAADYYGYKYKINFKNNKNKICEISLVKRSRQKSSKNHLINFINNRVTNRNEYIYSKKIEELIKKYNKNKTNFNVKFLNASEIDAESLATDVIDAGIKTFESDAFRSELSDHVRTNVTNKYTGMPAFGMGMPTPVSFIVPKLIKLLNVNKLSRKKDIELLSKHTPVFGLISSKNNNKKDWIEIGMLYEEIALEATKLGLSIHPYAGPIIIEKYNKKMKKNFEIKDIPQMFFRLGEPVEQTPHSPRLRVDSIISK